MDPNPGPKPSPEPQKDSSPAPPTTLAPDNSGVKTGDLPHTENKDGTRNYPSQKPVQTVDEPAK